MSDINPDGGEHTGAVVIDHYWIGDDPDGPRWRSAARAYSASRFIARQVYATRHPGQTVTIAFHERLRLAHPGKPGWTELVLRTSHVTWGPREQAYRDAEETADAEEAREAEVGA